MRRVDSVMLVGLIDSRRAQGDDGGRLRSVATTSCHGEAAKSAMAKCAKPVVGFGAARYAAAGSSLLG
jgi:hypothetical protein